MAQDEKTLKRANKGFNTDIMLFNQNYPLQLNKVCGSGSVWRHGLDALLMLQQAQAFSLIRDAELRPGSCTGKAAIGAQKEGCFIRCSFFDFLPGCKGTIQIII